MNRLRELRHRIAHLFHIQGGTVESKVWPGGTILIWFRCSTCGAVSGLCPYDPPHWEDIMPAAWKRDAGK